MYRLARCRRSPENGLLPPHRCRVFGRNGIFIRAELHFADVDDAVVAVMGLGYMSSLPPLTDAGSVRRWI